MQIQIANPPSEDYHLHSSTFSDGLADIETIVEFAGKIGLKKIAITDHSQAVIDKYGLAKKAFRSTLKRWKNVHNPVEVTFGVEGDLLNENGDICAHIQGIESDFLILSAHQNIYQGEPGKINEAYLQAMEKHHQKIKFLGHICLRDFQEYVDISMVVRAANRYQIPLEFNCANLVNGKTNEKHLQMMLREADRIYVNSDAHTLADLRDVRKLGREYLRGGGFLGNGKGE